MNQVRVNRRGADRLASGHPWVFSSDVTDAGQATAGDPVEVLDQRSRRLGTAHYSSTSQIALRLLDPSLVPIDRHFFLRRIGRAAEYRKRVVRDTDTFRLVYSEADLLPGLVVDRYGDCFAVQFLSQGMDRAQAMVVEALEELFSPRAIVARNDVAVRKKESLPLETGILMGELPPAHTVRMNGFTWRVDLLEGQKTGIFLDQRENYLAAAEHASGHALDCFTCSGGFAVHLASRCETVEAVDASAAALEAARCNLAANSIANVTPREADVFDLLASYCSSRRHFDTIVLDPPAFAKARSAVGGALRGYREINARALRLLAPGGTLVTCSCSHHVSEAALLEVVAQAALDAGRTLRVLERRTQSADHPILLTVPETHYLKCLLLQAL